MYDQDLVSIITPAFNCEKYIAQTIESVIQQTYTNWEMIIVNDHSTDNTANIIKEYQQRDSRIKLIDLRENAGAAVARNTAMDSAKGRYIAFLDSDDLWKSNKLKRQIDFMLKNKYGFTFTGYQYLNDDINTREKVFKIPSVLNYSKALKNTVIGCLTVVIDRSVIGDFRMPLVRRGQDNLTWLMLLEKGHQAYGLDENLAEYRRVTGSLSNNKIKSLKRQWTNYRKVIKLPYHKCVYYYIFYIVNNIKKYYFTK